jgi:hypothetical protein
MPLSLPLPQVIAIATDKIYRHATLCHAHDTLGIASRWLTRARTVLLYRWYVYIAHALLCLQLTVLRYMWCVCVRFRHESTIVTISIINLIQMGVVLTGQAQRGL